MRLINAIKSDIKFQYKQGFYFIYIVITLVYILILSKLPKDIIKIAAPLVVFSDPSVLGLFFIGGIIMLEKVQGIIYCIIVTPLKIKEYILAKIISLSAISVIVVVIITLTLDGVSVNWILLFFTIILTSTFFTLCGFFIGSGCNTINQYFIRMIPNMILLIIPCFSIIGFKYSYLLTIIPSVALLRLFMGVYDTINVLEGLMLIVYMVLINYYFFGIVKRKFENKVVYGGQ